MYKLKAVRVGKNIKQKDLAINLGITPQYLNNIEKGKTEPRRDLMIKIAAALDTTVQALFFDEEEWTKCQEHTTEMKQWNS